MEAKFYTPIGARAFLARSMYGLHDVLGADLHSEHRWPREKVIFISLDRDGISFAIWYLYQRCRHSRRAAAAAGAVVVRSWHD